MNGEKLGSYLQKTASNFMCCRIWKLQSHCKLQPYHAVAKLFKSPDVNVLGQGTFDVTVARYVPGANVSAEHMRETVVNTKDTISTVMTEKTATLKKQNRSFPL